MTNTIENNSIGIQLENSLDHIYCNRICNSIYYNLKYIGTNNDTIKYNYWYTPDSASTETVIFDGYDNAGYGRIAFMPWIPHNAFY